MQVFLVRHAEAVAETLDLGDPHRHLTPHGRQQARDLGDRLRWHDCLPSLVWSSPLVRAVQTAELVIGSLQHDVPIDIATSLAPGGSPGDLVAAIRALPPGAVVMLVGHEPSLSAIGAVLVGDPAFAALGTGCAARLDAGRVRWRFAWNDTAPQPGERTR